MALDERWRWIVKQGVRHFDGSPKTIAVGVEAGDQDYRVAIDTRGYASLTPDAADEFAAEVTAAADVVRRRQRDRRS